MPYNKNQKQLSSRRKERTKWLNPLNWFEKSKKKEKKKKDDDDEVSKKFADWVMGKSTLSAKPQKKYDSKKEKALNIKREKIRKKLEGVTSKSNVSTNETADEKRRREVNEVIKRYKEKYKNKNR